MRHLFWVAGLTEAGNTAAAIAILEMNGVLHVVALSALFVSARASQVFAQGPAPAIPNSIATWPSRSFPNPFASDRDRLMRFEREAKMLAALNHPHIAQIYGFEQSTLTGSGQAGISALVMELVEGALPIARQIIDALEAAHDQGIAHRDLKPANIKVRADGIVKVLDFGLAKAIDGSGGSSGSGRSGQNTAFNSPTITSPAMTAAGMILGTAAYMSPEQAKDKPADKRSDIWAFGCVLYEMLTGRRAFHGEDVTDTIVPLMSKEADWSALPATTPVGVRRLLARCLTKDRKRRLRDIGDAPHYLDDDAPHAVVAPVATARPSRLLQLAVLVLIVAVAALIVPVVSQWRDQAPASRPLRLTIDAPPKAARLLSPEISPDGTTVVFSSLAEGRRAPDLWIRRLSDPAPVLLQNSGVPNGAAFWSPDARAVVYPSGNALMLFDLATNTARALTKFTATLGGLDKFHGS